MFVSVIIPVLAINDYIRESIPHLLNLDFQDFEILILPNAVSEDEKREFSDPRIRLLPTEQSAPAYKRDMGARAAKGDILAFLDDDAYPRADWLKNAVRHFENSEVGGVGGPAVTPKNDPWLAQVSGAVYTSFLGGGNYVYRYWPGKIIQRVDDYPSVNLLIRKDIFFEVGGFDTHFWPGEDTKLCLDIVKKGKIIVYDPDVFVWHHRRPSVMKHLKQVANYAKHRGHFVKKFPETSLRLSYFIPTLFTTFLFAAPFLFVSFLKTFPIAVLGLYILLLFLSGFLEGKRIQKWSVGMGAIPLIFLTHAVYGIYFMVGVLRKKLEI